MSGGGGGSEATGHVHDAKITYSTITEIVLLYYKDSTNGHERTMNMYTTLCVHYVTEQLPKPTGREIITATDHFSGSYTHIEYAKAAIAWCSCVHA